MIGGPFHLAINRHGVRRFERNVADAYRTLTLRWREKVPGSEWTFRSRLQRPRLFRRKP